MTLNTKDDLYKLSFALDNIPSYIYMKDKDSKYIYANRATLELFDCTSESIVGKDDREFFSSDRANSSLKSDAEVLAGKTIQEEMSRTDVDGKLNVYLEKKTPIYKSKNSKTIVGILGVSTDITQTKLLENELEELTMHDSLTGAFNRQFIIDEIEKSMKRSNRMYNNCAILYISLNEFKDLNDKHGHIVGDKILIEIVKKIDNSIRESDTLARIGGDDFVVLLENLSTVNAQAKQESESIIKKIDTNLKKEFSIDGAKHQISTSIGFEIFSGDKYSVEEILEKASNNIVEFK